jgi:hypothetical protein
VLIDLLDAPIAAEIMPDNPMERIAAIAAQGALAHHLVDEFDAVPGAAGGVKRVAVELRCLRLGGCGLAALTPHQRPIEPLINIRQLLDGIEPIAGDGQDLRGTPEQLRGNLLAISSVYFLFTELVKTARLHCPRTRRDAARDLLAEAMLRIEAAGYPIVLHVHDEIVAEVPIGFGSEQEFTNLMTRKPAWALDLPIAAKAWSGPRYCK